MHMSCPSQQQTTAREILMGRLVRSLVHEISNPLQAIHGAASLAKEDLYTPSDLQQDLQIISEELQRLERLMKATRRLYQANPKERMQELLTDVFLLAQKELQWHEAQWHFTADETAAASAAPCPHAHLALTGLLLLLARQQSGLRLEIHLQTRGGLAALQLRLEPPVPPQSIPEQALEPVRCLLEACAITLEWRAAEIVLSWEMP